MNKTKKNTLNDLAKFLEFSENQAVKVKSKSKTSPKTIVAKDSVQPSALAPIESVSTQKEIAEKVEITNEEQNILAEIEALSEQTGLSKDRILANLMKRNLAQTSLQNFLLTDLMIKGSFLLFNFWVLLKDAQKGLESNVNLIK